MKQSKKLLSIFLAMLMLLGTVSVIGNAAQSPVTEDTKGTIAYDSVDNAALTADQVAFIILEMLDNDVMPGLGKMDLSILGSLDLTSVDAALTSVHDLLGGFLLGLLAGGDAQTLINKRDELKYEGHVVQRSDGDLQVVYQLLQFLGNSDVAGVLAKAPGGILTDKGINIGGLNGLVAGFVDLSSINNILTNIPGFLSAMVFDMLLYGSKGYDKDSEELGGKLPAEADTLDEIVDVAVYGLLTKPQSYYYDENGVKQWDDDSYILPAGKITAEQTKLSTNSVFSILDTALPIAYETFGTVVLNHDIKKIFMEAMGVDFVEVTDSKEIATIKADSDYIDVEKEGVDTSSVKNYFCNAQMWEVDGTWYFRDYVTRETGEYDKDGNPITAKVHRYQRAEIFGVDELYSAFNWNYYFTKDDLDFAAMLKSESEGGYGSLVGSLNHILRVVFEKALNPDYLTKMGTSVDALWKDGKNDNFNENLMRVAKFLLTNYTFMFFGRNPEYVDLNTLKAKPEFIAKINSFAENDEGREGLIAYMLLPFLGDALPQLVYSVDMFEDGLQIEQVAALLVREFLTDLTPQINDNVCDYDAQIFVDPSATNKQFKTHKSEEWMNIVLNMGLDLAAVYLDNIANFGVDLNALKDLHTIANGTTIQPWQVVLEEIVDWAVLYVGSGSNSVIKGLEPSTLGVARCITYNYKDDSYSFNKDNFVGGSGKGSAFYTLSTALNTILPLAIVNGCSSDSFGLDVEILFNKISKDIIPTLNIEGILGLFGRNNHKDNFLYQKNIPYQILNLVNRLLGSIFGKTILQAADNSTPLATILTNSNLGTTIKNLVMGLNERKVPLLTSVLPVLSVFVSGWGTAQRLGSPNFSLPDTINANDGTLTDYTVTIRNGSDGIWRSYMDKDGTRKQDQQYAYTITSITATCEGATMGTVNFTAGTKIAYGKETTMKFSVSGIPAEGALVRFVIKYKVSDESGADVVSGTEFQKVMYTFVSQKQTEGGARAKDEYGTITKKPLTISAPRYIYITDDAVNTLSNTQQLNAVNSSDKTGKKVSFTPGNTNAQDGIKLKSFSATIGKSGAADSSLKSTMFETVNYTGPVGGDGKVYLFSGNKVKADGEDDSFDLRVVVYNSEYKSKLEDLVSDELGEDRQEYNHSKAQFDVPEEYTAEDTNYFGGKIDGTAAWTEYKAALYKGATRAMQSRDTVNNFVDYKTVYERLYKAVNDIEVCELSDEEKMANDSANGKISADVARDYVAPFLKQYSEAVGEKDYRTYMLYRWNIYKDAIKTANNFIELSKRAKSTVETQRFPYRDITVAELNTILAADAHKNYKDFILVLLEDLSEEEIARKTEEHARDVRDYANTDIAKQAINVGLMKLGYDRLIKRTDKPVTSYLEKEIASASGLKEADYTAMSWAVFKNALDNANAAKSSDSQDAIFTAKYQLQVARNRLVAKGDEADYDELKAVIAQANAALQNAGSYKNDKEDFGAVIAALGYKVTDANGNVINLFPGSAIDVVEIPYGTHDQDELDDAADELKRALAKLEFKTYTKPAGVESTNIAGEDEEANNVYTKTIDPNQNKKAVAELLKGDYTVAVSFDANYTYKTDEALTEKIPVGTGATVTLLKEVSGVNIPVATIKIVVTGDVTGDGVIDALDCMVADIVKNGQSSLDGLYFLAGDVAANQKIDMDDVNAIVNKAVPDKIA